MKPLLLSVFGLIACTGLAPAAEGADHAGPPALQPSSELAALLEPLIAAHPGDVGVAIKHLGTGAGFVHRESEPMPTASLIKLAVMVTAYEQVAAGQLELSQLLPLRESDKVPGSGILTAHFSEGTQLTLRDAIRLMIAYSDNTATNLVIDAIGLPSTGKRMLAMHYPHTQLHSKVYRRDTSIAPERSARFGLGSTTAAETVALLEQIDRGQIVSRDVCDQMLEHLYACQDRGKLVRLLPPNVRVAHKSGYVSQTRVDAGLIDGPEGRIAICVLTDKNSDLDASDDNAASRLIANIAATTHRFFYPSPAPAPRQNALLGLAMAASGPEVRTLQQLLNDHSTPSPRLAVDGEFGPATESALLDYQRSLDLAPTGTVDEATLKKLAPVAATRSHGNAPTAVTDKPAADSEREEPLSSLRKEVFDGPPIVSCRAWAIADAATGRLLYQHQASCKLDNASTTKLMTAWLVAKLAGQDPSVLEERILFSKQADETNGSTADVQVGETVRVGDLLYGLLLPSGNDAAVALAEHFGPRLTKASRANNRRSGNAAGSPAAIHSDTDIPGSADGEATAYQCFVDAMNREAADLGLKQTEYKNPHGLTAHGHGCSARDLAVLARRVLQDPLLSKIVSTRRYRCDVVKSDGAARSISWDNTNELLGIEGYNGAKTGTTKAAGACLVASGKHDDRRLIVVVLGASGSPARYADARNLFRWAWQQPRQ